MRYLRITLPPDVLPVSESVEEGYILNVRYLSDGSILQLVRVVGDLDTVIDEGRENPRHVEFEIFHQEGDQIVFFVQSVPRPDGTARMFVETMDRFQLMALYPVRFNATDGMTVDLLGRTDKVQVAYDQLPPAIQRKTRIERVREKPPLITGLPSRLTSRQREILDAAIDAGYYSIPRQATVTDVAETVDCSSSTASEHLRKIEAHLAVAASEEGW